MSETKRNRDEILILIFETELLDLKSCLPLRLCVCATILFFQHFRRVIYYRRFFWTHKRMWLECFSELGHTVVYHLHQDDIAQIALAKRSRLYYWIQCIVSRYLSTSSSLKDLKHCFNTVVLNLGAIKPLGFDGAVSGVRRRSSETWLKAWDYCIIKYKLLNDLISPTHFYHLLHWAKWGSTKPWILS